MSLPPLRPKGPLNGKWRVIASLVCASISIQACSDRPPIVGSELPEPSTAALLAALSGAAASALDANGKFMLAVDQSLSGSPEISAARAVELAEEWGRDFGPLHITKLTKGHGSPIQFNELKACGRTLYAESPFQPPPTNWLRPFRSQYGPWWLVTLCARRGVAQVSVAISAWAVDLKIDNGRIVFPPESGNEFVGVGIPSGHRGEFPSAPEAAAILVGDVTGRRTVMAPRLLMAQPNDGVPQAARWHITLDADALLRTNRRNVSTDQVFVGSTRDVSSGRVSMWVPTVEQPSSIQVAVPVLPVPNENPQQRAARYRAAYTLADIAVKNDTPVSFETVREDR